MELATCLKVEVDKVILKVRQYEVSTLVMVESVNEYEIIESDLTWNKKTIYERKYLNCSYLLLLIITYTYTTETE